MQEEITHKVYTGFDLKEEVIKELRGRGIEVIYSPLPRGVILGRQYGKSIHKLIGESLLKFEESMSSVSKDDPSSQHAKIKRNKHSNNRYGSPYNIGK